MSSESGPDRIPDGNSSLHSRETAAAKSQARAFAREVWRTIRERRPEVIAGITSHWRKFLRERSAATVGRILIYLPLPDEIDLLGTLDDWDPALVFAPCTYAGHRMEFRRFAPESERPVPGFRNVPGPDPRSPLLEEPLRPEDLVVMPALGANGAGVRLGRGAGYYDRWRERLAPAERLGVLPAELSRLDFPGEMHDIKFNIIITEEGPLRP